MADHRLTSRIGGACLAIGSTIFICTIPAFVFLYGSPVGTGEGGTVTTPDQARHMLGNVATVRTIWIVESFAVLLLAIAGFCLAQRSKRRSTSAPVGWLCVGAGSTLYLGMYGLLLGAYWPAARVATEMPALLETANETAVAIFILSNVPINAGIALAFFVEARHETRNWWKRFAWLACVLAAVGAIVSAYTLAIDGGMAVALSVAPVGGVLFILLSVFGASFAIEE